MKKFRILFMFTALVAALGIVPLYATHGTPGVVSAKVSPGLVSVSVSPSNVDYQTINLSEQSGSTSTFADESTGEPNTQSCDVTGGEVEAFKAKNTGNIAAEFYIRADGSFHRRSDTLGTGGSISRDEPNDTVTVTSELDHGLKASDVGNGIITISDSVGFNDTSGLVSEIVSTTISRIW